MQVLQLLLDSAFNYAAFSKHTECGSHFHHYATPSYFLDSHIHTHTYTANAVFGLAQLCNAGALLTSLNL